MANWNEEQASEDARSIYRDRIRNAGITLKNQAQAFQTNFDSVRAGASAENQAMLDTLHATLVSQLKTALNIP